MKIIALLLTAGLVSGSVPAARAQDIGPALDPTLMVGWAGGEAVRYDLEKRAAAAKGVHTGARLTSATSFAYRSTPATRAQAVKLAAGQMQARNPRLAQALTSIFGPGRADYEVTYAQIISGTGLHTDNAADALACYMLMGYAVVHNIQDDKDITPAMARGVRQQIAAIMVADTKLRPEDPVASARLGEAFKLQAVVLQGGWQAAVKAGQLPAYQQQTATLFRSQYGLDLARLRLTSQGFARQ